MRIPKFLPENGTIGFVAPSFGASIEPYRSLFDEALSNFEKLPFTESDAILFGQLRALLALSGTPIGAYDVMIAAQGVSRGLTVVTHNTKEFSRIPGLILEDWVE